MKSSQHFGRLPFCRTLWTAAWQIGSPSGTTGGPFDFSPFLTTPKTRLLSRVFQLASTFKGMNQYPDVLEPLLFYILHRANTSIRDPKISHVFKAFLIDEAWLFLKNPVIKNYIIEALKTWRKQNAAMILSTQSLDELRKSEILDIIIESCPTKIFLANPDMDRELYRRQFNLNDNEIEFCDLNASAQAAATHQNTRNGKGRKPGSRCKELLALYE